jgi:hypothetical protein
MTELSIAVQKAYDWNVWILPKVEKFSKSYRFSLGLLTSLVDATYQQRNAAPLRRREILRQREIAVRVGRGDPVRIGGPVYQHRLPYGRGSVRCCD